MNEMTSFELSQRFYFEAAHTLQRCHDADASRRVHGHTYLAEVAVRGQPDPATGMVMDLALLRRAIDDLRGQLDHRLLDEVPGLGPATLENLCAFVCRALQQAGIAVAWVSVRREASGDGCVLRAGQ
jgi:6-pyruvoyltetrahydropterin/6-carboxytetrahydropterin synthase